MMEMKDIPNHDYIKARWIDLYPQNDTVNDSDLQLLCFSCCICMIDWCDEKYNFWPINIYLSPAEEKWLEEDVVKKGFKRFNQTGLVPYYMALRIQKKKKSVQCPYDRVHPLAMQFPYKCSNQCEHIYSECGSLKHVNRKI